MSSAVAKLDALTGLRFLAAFAVFFHHFGYRYHFFDTGAPIGGQAVSFFFVLSGFILTYVYNGRLKKGGVKRFYFTRWARIWPLHAVCLLAVLWLFPRPATFEAPFEQLKLASHWLLIQSWVPMNQWIFCFNGVSWSISTEMFFYLMFPLLFLGGQKAFWKKYAAIFILTVGWVFGVQWLSGMPSVTESINTRLLVHINPAFRLLEFATGMAAGFIFLNRAPVRKRRNFWVDTFWETITLGLAVSYDFLLRYFLVYHAVRNASWGGNEIVTAMIYGGGTVFFWPMIYVFARSQGFWSRLVSNRLMVYLGEISFAFYMVHQIVLQLIAAYGWNGSTLSPWVAFAGTGLISIGVSGLLYALVEIPMKNGLLKLYDRKPLEFIPALWKPARKFAFSNIGVVALVLIVIPTIYMVREVRKARRGPTADVIVNRTPPRFRDMQFGANATLVGWTIEPRRGGVQLNLVWRKEAGYDDQSFVRLIHLVGETKEKSVTIRKGNFMGARRLVGDLMVERIFLHKPRYRNRNKIEIELVPAAAVRDESFVRSPQLLVNEDRMAKTDARTVDMKIR